MGSNLLQCLKNGLQYTILFGTLLAFLPGLPPYIHFEPYTITPSVDLDTLTRVNLLDKAEVFLKGKVIGAESPVMLPEGDGFYAGLENGHLVIHRNGEISTIAEVGQICDTVWGGKAVCGRPLGLRLDLSGELLVARGVQGIIRLNPKTGKFEHLFDFKAKIQDQAPNFADDLDVSQDGSVYWSDVAESFDIFNPLEGLLESVPSGRLIRFDPTTKKNTVLIDGIHFADGVQLSEKEEFVLVCETIGSRILRYYLKGPKAGQQDIFLDGLPGMPANIRANGKGGYYVALYFPRQFAIDTLGGYPIVRKMILRFQRLLIGVVSFVRAFVPENFHLGELPQFISDLFDEEKILGTLAGPSRILDVDGDGKILRVLEHSQDKVIAAAQLTIGKDFAYIGRVPGDYILRIKMADLNDN